MNLRDLDYLIHVATLKSFSKAAKQCHVSQPTLSGQIKKMEERLGVNLFERTNKKVLLTDIGARIVESAKLIQAQVHVIHELAANVQDPLSGPFKLGAFPTIAPYLLPKLVPKIKHTFPNLKLMLVEEKTDILIDKVQSGVLDAAILALPVQEDALVGKALLDDPFYLAVPINHPLQAYEAIDRHDLNEYGLLLLEEGHCLRDQALDFCQSSPIDQEFKATSLETLRQMVIAGSGITLLPRCALQQPEEDFVVIPFKGEQPKRVLGLFCRKSSVKLHVIDALEELICSIEFHEPNKTQINTQSKLKTA